MTRAFLAEVPRRSRQVEQDFRTRGRQFPGWIRPIPALGPEIRVVPDILADRDADAVPVELDRHVARRRFEIAVLVEDVVGRQQGLLPDGNDAPILDALGRV